MEGMRGAKVNMGCGVMRCDGGRWRVSDVACCYVVAWCGVWCVRVLSVLLLCDCVVFACGLSVCLRRDVVEGGVEGMVLREGRDEIDWVELTVPAW
jgi:hypothetical protein